MAKLSDRILGERVSGYVTKPNLLDNSNFQIHQRGTSFSGQTSSQFLSDRWNIGLTGGVVSTSAINNNSFPDSDSRYEQLFRNQTGVGTVQVQQKLAAIAKTFPSSGQLTLSFWARSGVNATTTVTPSINIVTDDGSSFIQGVAEALTATPRLITWTFDAFDWKGANTSDDSYQNVRFTMGTDAADMILADIKLEEGNTFTGYEPTPYAIDEAECLKWLKVWETGATISYDSVVIRGFSYLPFPSKMYFVPATQGVVTVGASTITVRIDGLSVRANAGGDTYGIQVVTGGLVSCEL